MADLVVKDLDVLLGDLKELIDQFKGALDFQNDEKGHWGQLNANLSMGDFADNWTIHRDKMVEKMEAFCKTVQAVDEKWTEEDKNLTASFEGDK